MKKQEVEVNKRETWYPFRNLDNYKSMHAKIAKSKDKYEELMAAKTLTAARRILFGR